MTESKELFIFTSGRICAQLFEAFVINFEDLYICTSFWHTNSKFKRTLLGIVVKLYFRNDGFAFYSFLSIDYMPRKYTKKDTN